jgi:aspartate/methionine/tyrosine aminotransferase
MTPHMGKLVEFNTSCASVFTQRAGVVALAARTRSRRVWWPTAACRDTLVPLLQALPGVQVAPAPGGMYAFFRLEGQADALATAKRLVPKPAWAWRPATRLRPRRKGWLRWCFASRDPQRWCRAWIGWNPGWPPRQPESVARAIILGFCIPQNARWGAVPAPNASCQNPFRKNE